MIPRIPAASMMISQPPRETCRSSNLKYFTFAWNVWLIREERIFLFGVTSPVLCLVKNHKKILHNFLSGVGGGLLKNTIIVSLNKFNCSKSICHPFAWAHLKLQLTNVSVQLTVRQHACFIKKGCYRFKIRCLCAFLTQTRSILSRLPLFAFFFWRRGILTLHIPSRFSITAGFFGLFLLLKSTKTEEKSKWLFLAAVWPGVH